MGKTWRVATAYVVAVGVVGAALAVRLFVSPLVQPDVPFLMFFLAVMLSAWYGGLGPGLVTTILATATVDYFFLAPHYEMLSGSLRQNTPLLIFLVEGVVVSVLADRLRRAKRRSEERGEQLRATNVELERKSRELREAASDLTRAEQAERRRVGAVLHDDVQQLLVGVKFHLQALRARMTDVETRQALEHASGLQDEAIRSTRTLAHQLSPPVLEQEGLRAGLEWLAGEMEKVHGLKVGVRAQGGSEPESDEVRTFLFESVRELLFNVVKHARTSEAEVRMRRSDDGRLRVEVADAGVGFDPERVKARSGPAGGVGLLWMRDRLSLMGGEMEIVTSEGKGCRVALTVPAKSPS